MSFTTRQHRLKIVLLLILTVMLAAVISQGWETAVALLLVGLALLMARQVMAALHQVPDRVLHWIAAESDDERRQREAIAAKEKLQESTTPITRGVSKPRVRL
jgi:ABC-type methionine transport system permease subunit